MHTYTNVILINNIQCKIGLHDKWLLRRMEFLYILLRVHSGFKGHQHAYNYALQYTIGLAGTSNKSHIIYS